MKKPKNGGKKVSKNKKTEPALCARLGMTVLAGTYGAVCLTSNFIICNSEGIVKRI